MTTITDPKTTLKIEIEIDAIALLDSVWCNIFRSTSPWILSYSYDWKDEDRGSAKVVVKYKDGESDKIRQRTVTPMMLAKAFQSLVSTSFWGHVVSADPEEMDAIQADACVQRAIFGKEVYA